MLLVAKYRQQEFFLRLSIYCSNPILHQYGGAFLKKRQNGIRSTPRCITCQRCLRSTVTSRAGAIKFVLPCCTFPLWGTVCAFGLKQPRLMVDVCAFVAFNRWYSPDFASLVHSFSTHFQSDGKVWKWRIVSSSFSQISWCTTLYLVKTSD